MQSKPNPYVYNGGDFIMLLVNNGRKEKKELETLIKDNGYNEELQDTYMREILDDDKEFDEDFDIDWEV